MSTTRAILLRKRRLSDTSLIVSWCTEEMGVLRTVARGARRPKNPFAGRLDLFFEAEISVIISRKTSLHTLREVSITNAFPGIRARLLRMQLASYFVELVELCTESEHREPELFHLLHRAFRYLSEQNPNRTALLHFEGELARITGVQESGKNKAAGALAQLFGKLPAARPALLKALPAA